MKASLQRMFLKVPYLSIIFYMLFLAGISINIFCVIKASLIFQKFSYDMFKRDYIWLRDLKIFVVAYYAYTILLMTYNLVIAFRCTGIVSVTMNYRRERIYCLDSAIVQKILYFVNHLTLMSTFAVTLFVTLLIFIFTTLKELCTSGSNVPKMMPLDPYKIGISPGELGQALDMREFVPLIGLRSNETMYLYFQNDRLKTFCDDYISMLFLFNLINFIASIITLYAMFNIVLTFGFNLSRNVTKKKLQELYYLHNSELSELQPNNSY